MTVVLRDNTGNVIKETLPIWRKRRYHLALFVFCGFINIFTLRFFLNVTILEMVSKEHADWDQVKRGIILSSFFYGHTVSQLFCGIIESRVPDFIIFGVGVLISSILTLVSPVAVKANFETFIALRVVMGLIEGFSMPSMHDIWSKWAPPYERTRMCGLQYAGGYTGTVLSLSTCGILAYVAGYESVFYVYGSIGCVWAILWLALVRGSPETDLFISDEEKKYIEASLEEIQNLPKEEKAPLKPILTSSAVWAIIIAHFAEDWGIYTMMTQLPSFLNEYLDSGIAESGFMTAIPYIVFGLTLIVASFLADWFQQRKTFTTYQVRKYFTCIAFLSQGSFVMIAAYQTNKVLLVTFISLGAAFGALSTCGYAMNHLDIAPQYASTVKGLCCSIAALAGAFAPLVAGFIVKDISNHGQWKLVFIIAAHIYFAGCLIFWFFSSAEIQPWAKSINDKNLDENKNNINTIERQDSKNNDNIKDKPKYRKIVISTSKVENFLDKLTSYGSKILEF